MWVLKINNVDSSCHSLESDADAQKQRFIDLGTLETDIEVVETDTFNPPNQINV